MIGIFKSEFERIATLLLCEYTTKKISELQDYAQNYNFENPLINLIPINEFRSEIGASSQVIYDGTCKLQFLTKAVKSDNFEDTKDALIDQMILVAQDFYRELDKNSNLVFTSPRWSWSNRVMREYLSNYLVGIDCTIVFKTSCSRLNIG